jgi:rare lipoprotein A
MYYNDSFEGKHTSAGNIFSQEFFSAAKCGTPLNTLTQVILNQKSLLVKVNDRPSCTRFPNLIDLSTNAFDPLYRRYAGKQK